jgi:hypothetical protein
MLRVLYDPDGFFKDYRDGWILPIAIVGICAVVNAILGYLKIPEILKETLSKYPLTPAQAEMLRTFLEVQAIVTTVVGVFLGWVILAGILHAISALFKGSGEFTRTLKNTSFALLPNIILAPISFSFTSLKPTPETMIIGLANYLWQGYILVFALKYARNVETRKAVICVAIPLAIMYLVGLVGYILSLKLQS